MKVFFDTEFHEDGKTIEIISIGLVREDGASLYLESSEYDKSSATPWLKENVIPWLTPSQSARSRKEIARVVRHFCGENPEFWAYYADYDWVVLCQLFGTMMDLPNGWPMYCRDIKQLCDNVGNPRLPSKPSKKHHALADAKWNKEAWVFLTEHDFYPDETAE